MHKIRPLKLLRLLLLAAAVVGLSSCKEKSPNQAAIVASLQWQTGLIDLPDQQADIALPQDLRFLDSEDARKLLVIWGGGDAPGLLGMICPTSHGPMDKESWGAKIIYGPGNVKDDQAIDPDQILAKLKAFIVQKNAGKTTHGGVSTHLISWAVPPNYDRTTHKFYWAQEMTFGDFFANPPDHILNYNACILGRRGTFLISIVSTMKNLHEVNSQMQQILSIINFKDGSRYSDFDPNTDKTAPYGLAGLIAAGTIGL